MRTVLWGVAPLVLFLALAAHADDTQVWVGKGGVSVETGGTKVQVGNDVTEVAEEGVADDSVEESDDDGLVVNGSGIKKTVKCRTDKESLVINGAGHAIVVNGECKEVTVNGTGHKVTIEAAGSIVVNGTGSRSPGRRVSRASLRRFRSQGSGSRCRRRKPSNPRAGKEGSAPIVTDFRVERGPGRLTWRPPLVRLLASDVRRARP
ncbi:MAG: DUF3060 domain-containing protein [Deltaproteobacteria bacterium]|nr:DUF3060 domain-containing protein [Deltaproteobacteria bacterium]